MFGLDLSVSLGDFLFRCRHLQAVVLIDRLLDEAESELQISFTLYAGFGDDLGGFDGNEFPLSADGCTCTPCSRLYPPPYQWRWRWGSTGGSYDFRTTAGKSILRAHRDTVPTRKFLWAERKNFATFVLYTPPPVCSSTQQINCSLGTTDSATNLQYQEAGRVYQLIAAGWRHAKNFYHRCCVQKQRQFLVMFVHKIFRFRTSACPSTTTLEFLAGIVFCVWNFLTAIWQFHQ